MSEEFAFVAEDADVKIGDENYDLASFVGSAYGDVV